MKTKKQALVRGYPWLTGERFGAWTVLAPQKRLGWWDCQCVCGEIRSFSDEKLHGLKASSCGCLQTAPGRVYGCFTVIRNTGRRRMQHWLCVCECGALWTRSRYQLEMVPTLVCPHRKAHPSRVHLSTSTAGRRRIITAVRRDRSPNQVLRQIWRDMKRRCFCPTSRPYPHYGGRGITVCERWLSFGNFLTDMGNRPKPHLTIDRIDNDGNYEPGNCRWATRKQQANNRSTNRYLVVGRQRRTLTEWSEARGIPEDEMRRRLREGWEVGRALSLPGYT